MVEVKDFGTGYTVDDFLWEYENGNFKNGERILSFSDFRTKMNILELEESKNE